MSSPAVGGLDELVGVARAPWVDDVVDDRLAGERLVADARAAVPRGALPEALGGGVGVGLGRLEPVVVGRPRRDDVGRVGVVGADVRPVERLGRPATSLEPKPSASRW